MDHVDNELITIVYRECFVMFLEDITVLGGVNGNNLVSPAVNVL